MALGIVSSRVALLLRSAEIKPTRLDFAFFLLSIHFNRRLVLLKFNTHNTHTYIRLANLNLGLLSLFEAYVASTKVFAIEVEKKSKVSQDKGGE